MKFDRLVESLLNDLLLEDSGSSNGIAFRKNGNTDVGCCIGVKHNTTPKLSPKLINRIKNMNGGNLSKGFQEGAGRDKIDPILNQLGIKGDGNWDTRLGNEGGTRNPKYSSVYLFMAFDTDGNPNNINKFKGDTIEEALRNWINTNKGNIMQSAIDDIKKADRGIYAKYLSQPFSSEKLNELFTHLQNSVYPPPKYQLNPKSFFGEKMYHIEEERNQSLYDCMDNGGVAFAGAGHLTELKDQFKDKIELLDTNKTIL
jgi:hypothetical protein